MPVSAFTNESDEIVLKLAIGEVDQTIVCDTDKSALLKIHPKLKEEDIEEATATFRMPTYGDMNRIFDASVKVDDLALSVSPAQIRFERLCVLSKSWSFKDAKGEKTKPSRENVRKLHPIIATYLGLYLEEQLKKRSML
jgi:hypothetical protein